MLAGLKLVYRQLVKSPGFTATAVVTLALGICANAVVFSMLNAVVLHPVKLPGAERLYTVQRFHWASQSYLDYLDLRDRTRSFDGLVAYEIIGPVGVDEGARPSVAWPYLASGNYFDTLGVEPYLGRFFHAADEQGKNSAPYVVLSYAYWQAHFHGDAGIVGRTLAINKHPMTVLGVARPGFRGTEVFFAPAMWIPIVEAPLIQGNDFLANRSYHSPMLVGRLKAGVTPESAVADMNALGAWLSKTYPADDEGVNFTLAKPGLIGDMLAGPARAFMAGLMLLAGLILLAACANLGSLFAARAADRGRELALRLALGSKRSFILRQLLTEALAVSVTGGLLGVGLALLLLHGLSSWNPMPDIPINVPVNPELSTYLVSLGLSVLSGLLFGAVPVRQVLRVDPWQTIRTGGRDGDGMRRFTVRDLLLAGQIAICAVLVTSSLVAVRGLMRTLCSNFGFTPQNVLLVECDLRMAGFTDETAVGMQRRMMDAVAAIPGVTNVGFSSQLPLSLGGGDGIVFADSTTDYRPSNSVADAMNYNISPGYMASAGTRLLAGRDIRGNLAKDAPHEAMINRRFAEVVFGSVEKAVGGHFKYWDGKRAEVVGVVEDGRYRFITEDQQPAMFFSYEQQPGTATWLVVRSNRPPEDLAPALDRALRSLDSAMPLVVRSWQQEMGTVLFPSHVATLTLGILGLLGAMLAVTGIFGMASYVVSKRLRELGVRVALGAGSRQILSATLGRTLRLLAIGSAAGVVLGLLGTKVLAAIVYQASPRDPMVLAGVTMTMLALGMVASWIPARRALRVDPMILLREE